MKVFEILLIVFCAAIVIGVIAARIVRKKKGKPSCDCGCSDCSCCSACQKAKKDIRK
ncbi:MAG: FeoB-associated Cys-rich membrane protein [Clostridia bacterium]|nr:FeoB-associated Cys-rich membrane protein [Clostridia bacterium]